MVKDHPIYWDKQQQRYNDTHEPHKPDSRTYGARRPDVRQRPPPPAPPSEFEESLKYLTDIANRNETAE
jgi:hypothetical protein